MTSDDNAFLVGLCAERAGLRIDPHKAYLIESRLGPVARREGFGSVGELVEAVRVRGEERLAIACVEAMAPSETAFFRDRAVFEHLWREVVPKLARRRPDGAVRIWSVGCGAGQEVYSFAMLQADEPAPTGPVELFASDLSERLLDRARLGVYSSFEVQRGLSARQLVRHFENRDEHFQLAKRLRQDVRWRRVNLLDDLAPLGVFDVVLCRYVLSALTDAARARAADQLSRLVAGDGVLVLGQGEPAPPGFVTDPAFGCVLGRAADVRAAA
ncbi:protein-glutamate O-methyltransferase CheR [Phenylobacterium sp. LjRoot219]|uniref:CheR family methyltransferase n=1 Tax=Phenylobacterium sp. LjRoot219 TaxID=3342283 RepID=UPI003ED0A334